MDNIYSRTELLIGKNNLKKLNNTKVAVVGIGGVGGAAAEALYRAGIENLILVDHDTVDITNINRQLFATSDSVGQNKCDVALRRLLSINNTDKIVTLNSFYSADNRQLFDYSPDYIIDAIDTVSAKLDLIETANKKGVKIISSMGTGNRLNPTEFKIGDISDTAGCGCGLARVMRRELRKRGIEKLPVVYSTETPKTVIVPDSENGRHAPGSISFSPPVAGYLLASYVINSIIDI